MAEETPLVQNKSLSEFFNLSNLFIKDESKNEFGTIKDRRSKYIISLANKKNIQTLALITSGNAGYSLAKYIKKFSDIKVVSIVDKFLKKEIKDQLSKQCLVKEIDLSSKIYSSNDILSLTKDFLDEKVLDVSNGFEQSYHSIIKELKTLNPDYILTSIGSGETFVGLHDALLQQNMKSILIGVTPKNKLISLADKLTASWTPYANKIKELLSDSRMIVKLEEKEIKDTYDLIKEQFSVEPSSAIAFGALNKLKIDNNKTIVVINSGKGLV